MKPYVICHMCTTIDGKILGSRWGKMKGVGGSATLFETTAATFKIPTWIVGTTTMREFSADPFKLKKSSVKIPHEDYVADPSAKSFAIGADAKGVLRWKTSESGGDHVVLLITRAVSNDYLAHLRAAGVSYFFCGQKRVDPSVALEKISKYLKVKKVMVQGGGKMNGAFLRAGLIDEISQVMVPIVDGGEGITAFFDIADPVPAVAAAHLRVLSQKKLPGGVNWFRYRVIKA